MIKLLNKNLTEKETKLKEVRLENRKGKTFIEYFRPILVVKVR